MAADNEQELVILHRFRGPHASGNGGYSAGILAQRLLQQLGAVTPAVPVATPDLEVTLRLPPPLDVPLQVHQTAEGAELKHGEQLIAQACTTTFHMEVPTAPPLATARQASAGYRGFEAHILPECFVCGTQRAPGDGLRIFAGPLSALATAQSANGQAMDDSKLVATTFVPDESLGYGVDGGLETRFVWAVLDCPSYFALARPELRALLGRMKVHMNRAPRRGEECIVVGAPLSSEGRKHDALTALYNREGEPLAYAQNTWIELKN